MALICYPVPGKAKSDLICKAFAAGAPRNAEGAVFFGTEGQMSAYQKAQTNGRPWFYVDNSYFDKHRGTYFRVTKNALQVAPHGKESDGKRFAKLGVEVKPWRTHLGRDVLVVPQSDKFMKSTLGRSDDWGKDMVHTLMTWGVEHVRLRPWQSDKVKLGLMLLDDLPNLRLLVTWSSASAITALLEGVPAISESGAARSLTGPLTVAAVIAPPRPSVEERLQFAQVLADNQFTLEEFRNGTAWAHLKKS